MPRKKTSTALVLVEVVQQRIFLIRGQRVIFDADLAELYGVTTKRLNQQVSRNADRFPDDFMFQPTEQELEILRLQFATSSLHGGRRYAARVFTEHGVLMAANVLRSAQASKASVFIVRAFVKLRKLLSTHHQLAAKLDELERKLQDHDEQFVNVFDAIRQIMDESEDPPKPPIGFATEIAGDKQLGGASRRSRRLTGKHT